MSTLDPRAPLVIDTHDLGRRPGHQRETARTVAAPAGLGIEMLSVPQGAEVDLDLRLEAVMEGVLVTGTASAPLSGECVRCLEPISDEIEVELTELFLYDSIDVGDDEEVRVLEGELADLEQTLRDALVLALPLQPLCRPDCAGLCVECGENLNDDPDHSHEAGIDPRWATLSSLTEQQPE